MEKRLKVSDFAELVGCTPKTVYKMIERNELNTVTEKVNFRETTVIVTNDEQLRNFQIQFGKLPVNDVQCNEIATYNEGNEPVNYSNYKENFTEFSNKLLELTNTFSEQLQNINSDFNQRLEKNSQKYDERLNAVNEELVNARSQMLFLTDKLKSDNDSKDYWQKEYFKKEYEVKQSEKSKSTVIIWLVSVIFVLFLGLITLGLLYSFEKQKTNDSKVLTGRDTVIEQPVTVNNPTSVKTQETKKNNKPKKTR